MNELNLYAIIQAIFDKSKVIEGRFHIAPGEGSELNTNQLDQIVVDMLGAITESKKFPLVMGLPPVEIINPSNPGWSRFKMKLLFLTPFESNQGLIKMHNRNNNTSGHPIHYDWKDMRECAQDFISAFEYVVRKAGAMDKIRPVDSESLFIDRHTKLGNDKCNGVSITISVDIYLPCEMADYRTNELDAIQVNLGNIHPIHKH